jgi:hypothetical protein
VFLPLDDSGCRSVRSSSVLAAAGAPARGESRVGMSKPSRPSIMDRASTEKYDRQHRVLCIVPTLTTVSVLVLGLLVAGAASLSAAPAEAASSGQLGFAQIEGFWVSAGGPASQAPIAAAITGAESTFRPGAIQQGVSYCGSGSDKAGWGLWQITCGNSEPQFCIDFQVLDPWNNAEAAVAKYRAAGDSFSPWTTYNDGAYKNYLPKNPPAPASVTDPGEYVADGAAPSGTHNTSQPGSKCGPLIAAASGYHPSAYVMSTGSQVVDYTGTNGGLWEAVWTPGKGWGNADFGMGPLGSSPAGAVSYGGTFPAYAFWEGTDRNLWMAETSGGSYTGPTRIGMGPLASAPAATTEPSSSPTGKQIEVWWMGTDRNLWEAYAAPGGAWHGPYRVTSSGNLTDGPTAFVTPEHQQVVLWRGTNHNLWEILWSPTSGWGSPVDFGMGPLASAPSAVETPGALTPQYVFWQGTDNNIWMAESPGGHWNGPYKVGFGPVASGPAATMEAASSPTRSQIELFWKGTDRNLWEGYETPGGSWHGPSRVTDNASMG